MELEGEERDGTLQVGACSKGSISSISSSVRPTDFNDAVSSSSSAGLMKMPESLDMDSWGGDAEKMRMGVGSSSVVLIVGEVGEGVEESREEEEPDEIPVSEAVGPDEGGKGADSVAGVVWAEGVGVGAEEGVGRALDLGGGARGARGLVKIRGEVGVESDEGEGACSVGRRREGRSVFGRHCRALFTHGRKGEASGSSRHASLLPL